MPLSQRSFWAVNVYIRRKCSKGREKLARIVRIVFVEIQYTLSTTPNLPKVINTVPERQITKNRHPFSL